MTNPRKVNSEYHKQYYLKNKDRIIERTRKRYKENQESCLLSNRNWIMTHTQSRLWSQAKSRAKREGIEFSLRKEDINIPQACPIFGTELTYILGKGRQKYNPSIDRIDSTKGYTPDNIQIISDLANRMKSDSTQEELLTFAKGIVKLYEREFC